MKNGFVWCPHCRDPHPLEERFCHQTGKPIVLPHPLRQKPTTGAPEDVREPSAAERHVLHGRVLDRRYRLIAPIGEGGSSTVFEADDLVLRRRVAVKVAKGGSPTSLERLRREAHILACVRHPNVCDVFGVGMAPDLGPYVVFERLSGETLAARMRRNAGATAERVFPLFSQILVGLAAAHAAGIVHRDLKPENVFVVTQPNGEPLVKLLDFGLAKRTDNNQDTKITRPGAKVGTLQYMAPEQMCGKPVDHAIDVFAFGVMLFEALAGRHPYPIEGGRDVVATMLVEEPFDLGDLRPDVPKPLVFLVARCLEKNPRDRPSIAALRLGLEKCRDAVLSRPGTLARVYATSSSGSSSGVPSVR